MEENNRILIIDDNRSIHDDFDKALNSLRTANEDELDELEKELFDDVADEQSTHDDSFVYLIDHAFSGEQGLRQVKDSKNEGSPYVIAFVDERMPPGIDGIQTIKAIWEIDPDIEIVICTAYSDYTWDEIVNILGVTDKLLILKKPFDIIEVKQLALALIKKWNLGQESKAHKKALQRQVKDQTTFIEYMFDFANTLNSLNNLDSILDCIIESVLKFIKADRISIMLLDESGEFLTIRKAVGIEQKFIDSTKIKVGSSIAGHVFEMGRPIVVNDLKKAGLEHKYSDYNSFVSLPFVCSPLMGNKVKIGVMNITDNKNDIPFSDEDIDIISYISFTSAIALNNQLNELKLEESFLGTIKALADAIEAKDYYTGGHSERVAGISAGIKNELGIPEDEIPQLNYAGILHDIGKIGIPESVLCKKGRLTDEEYDIIKKHPEIGEGILKNIKYFGEAREIIRHHHERMDGTGYPDRLKDEEISLGAKIVAVADAFDAMNSDRVYRKKKTLEDIKNELRAECGIKLDTQCVEALFRYIEKNPNLNTQHKEGIS